jgi:outer membrane receptor for ferrienterochelin and colicin
MHKTLNKLSAGILLAVGSPSVVMAVDDAGDSYQMMVTATRVEQSVVDVNASVQVISAEQLAGYSGRSLSEVLQFATGMIVRDLGSTSSISIRGFEYGHTLVLVDGLRRTEKYAGSNINNISLENIERIEIVRGPMSALYGSEALGGVVNIITRKPDGETRTELKATIGQAENDQRETYILHGNTTWGSEAFGSRLGVEIKRRKPFRQDPDSPVTDINEEQRSFISYEGKLQLNDTDEVALTAEYLDQDDSGTGQNARTLATYDRLEQEQRYFFAANYSGLLNEGLLDLRASYGSSDARVNRGTALDETTEFDQLQLEMDYGLDLTDAHFLNTGVGYRIDDAAISTLSQDVERKVYDLFVQDQWDITDNINLTMGARYDHYSDFGGTLNPRFMLSWRPENWTFRIGYGEGFKAPTLLNLYMTDMIRGRYVIRGNPDLQPEESRSLEAAMAYAFERGRLEVSLHSSKIDNLIESQLTGNIVDGYTESVYYNIAEAEIKGVEAVANLNIDSKSKARLSIEYLDARDATTDERLIDRPRWQASASLDRRFGLLKVEGRVRHVEDFWGSDATTFGSPNFNSNFTTMDVNLEYPLSDSFSLFGGIDNLFNAQLPANMAWRGTPDDPGARYYYAGVKASF